MLPNSCHKRQLIAFLALLLLSLSGCGLTRRVPDDAIAVVGKNAITLSDVTKIIEDMELDPNDSQIRAQVINRWVDRQILLHEARRRGLHRDKVIDKRIEEIREELIINSLFDSAIRVDQPTDEEVVSYWQNHTGEFTRVTDEVQLIIAYAPSRNTAWAIRNGLDQSRTDTELMSSYKDVDFDTTNYISEDRLPRQVTRAIDPLRSGQASLPFLLEDRWLVVKLLGREGAGQTRPLEEMMPIIRAQLYSEERAREEVSYIEGLRREARRHGIVRINSPAIMAMSPAAADTVVVVPEEEAPEQTERSTAPVEQPELEVEPEPVKVETTPTASPPDTFDADAAITEPSGAIPGAVIPADTSDIAEPPTAEENN